MPRPREPLLSQDVIADAAIELIESGAPFGVNAIARRIGVTPSSLYHHVDGRDAIVELVRGRLLTLFSPPQTDGSWEHVVEEQVRYLRTVYAAHPALLSLIVGKTVTDDGIITQYDRLASALLQGGFPEREILSMISVIDAFTLGFGLDRTSPDEVWRPKIPTRDLGRLIAQGQASSTRSDEAFEIGVTLLLSALRSRLAGMTHRDQPIIE